MSGDEEPPPKLSKREALGEAIYWVRTHEDRMLEFASDPHLSAGARNWKMAEHAHAKRARQWLELVEKHFDAFVRVISAEYEAKARKDRSK